MASHTGSKSVKKHFRSKTRSIRANLLSIAPAYAPVDSQLKGKTPNSRDIVRHIPLPDPFWNSKTTPSYNNTAFIPCPNYLQGLSLQADDIFQTPTPIATPKTSSPTDSSPCSSLAPQTPQNPFAFGTPPVRFEPLSEDKQLDSVQIKLEHPYSTQTLSQTPSNFGHVGYASQRSTTTTRHVSFAETIKQEPNDHLSQHISNTLTFKSQKKSPSGSSRGQLAVTPVKRPAKRKGKPIIKKNSSPPPSRAIRKSVRKKSTSPPPSLVITRLRPTSQRVAKLFKHQENLRRVECEQKTLIVKLLVHPRLLNNLKSAGYIFPSNYNLVPKLFKTQYQLPNRSHSRRKAKSEERFILSIATTPSCSHNPEVTGNVLQLPLQLRPNPSYTHPQAYTPSDLIDTVYPGYFDKAMAPGYRTQNRRQNRGGYVDHDVLEGLPVRQWRRDYVTVAPPAEQESSKVQNDIWAVELPHGMPKDSHLLPQHSQDLLRAARSGRIYKRPAPVEEEDADPEIVEKHEKKEDENKEIGFSARAWKQIPRQQEGQDLEYLAKRRKGLVTYSKPLAPVPTVVKTTVRRTDAAGNQYTQDVVVPHGQQVDGEVVAQTVIPDPSLVPAPETFGVQATPPKRSRPIQKKKLKGPGRGRKKKVPPPTSAPQAIPIDGAAQAGTSASPVVGVDAVKTEPEDPANPGTKVNEDTEMGEGSNAASDDEDGDEDGDEDDNDNEEGSVGDQSSPSKATKPMSPTPTMHAMPDMIPGASVSPPANPLIAQLGRETSFEGRSGSPLKNVALATSALASPMVSPSVTAAPPFPDNSASTFAPPTTALAESEAIVEHLQEERAEIDHAMQMEVVESAPTTLPPPPPAPTEAELQASNIVRKEEEEEEMMLLDIVEKTNVIAGGDIPEQPPAPVMEHAKVPSPTVAATINVPTETEDTLVTANEQVQEALSNPNRAPIQEVKQESVTIPELKNDPPLAPAPEEAVQAEDEDDDDFPDLLGGLEKSLGQPAPSVLPASVVKDTPEAETPVGDAEALEEEEQKIIGGV